jgi:hypothetical protein
LRLSPPGPGVEEHRNRKREGIVSCSLIFPVRREKALVHSG